MRLFEDVTEELSAAVERRCAAGYSQADIAYRVDMDPAFLSRVLAAQAGTNLRSIAAILCATDHVMQVRAVPIEESIAQRNIDTGWRVDALHFVKSGNGLWELSEAADNVDAASQSPADYQLIMYSKPLEVSHG